MPAWEPSLGSASGHAGRHWDRAAAWQWTPSGDFGLGLGTGRGGTGFQWAQGSCCRTRQLEISLPLQTSAGGEKSDSWLLGALEAGTTFQEGNLATQTQVLEMCILMAQHFHG